MIFATLPVTYAADEIVVNESISLTKESMKNAQVIRAANGVWTVSREYKLAPVSKSGVASFKKDSVALIATNEEDQRALDEIMQSARSSGGSHSEYEWDSSGAVKAYSTVYYERGTYSGQSTVNITKVTVGYEKPDVSVRVEGQELFVGQTGKTTAGTKTQTKTSYPSGTSSTWTPPSSWYPVMKVDASQAGATYTLTLGRGSSTYTWKVAVYNNLGLEI